ncbi:MAG: hypothetical protein MZU95_04245 [Desulfomicrobium escambiense]|nr:hypothetical protein [Desulfomicrobium escambiense]
MLALKGFIPLKFLERYAVNDGILPCHLDMAITPGIEVSTSSLGHGLSIGVGMAIANKIDNNKG